MDHNRKFRNRETPVEIQDTISEVSRGKMGYKNEWCWGCLAGSVNRECDFQSWGWEFKPCVGGRVLL